MTQELKKLIAEFISIDMLPSKMPNKIIEDIVNCDTYENVMRALSEYRADVSQNSLDNGDAAFFIINSKLNDLWTVIFFTYNSINELLRLRIEALK
jgi:hypothetical protein